MLRRAVKPILKDFLDLFSLKGSGSCVSSDSGHESHVSRHYYCCLSSVFFLQNPVTSGCPLEDSGNDWVPDGLVGAQTSSFDCSA